MPDSAAPGYESPVCFRLWRRQGPKRLAFSTEAFFHRRASHQDPRTAQVTFDLEARRFHLSARRSIQFPPWMAGNVLRGALGSAVRGVVCAEDYLRVVEPGAARAGPSGLSNWPRPYVIRGAALNGRIVQPGEQFCFDLHLFDTRDAALEHFMRAFADWADLVSVDRSQVAVDLDAPRAPVSRIRVEFQTPTEIKAQGGFGDAEFSILLARARDRLSTLRSLYGAG